MLHPLSAPDKTGRAAPLRPTLQARLLHLVPALPPAEHPLPAHRGWVPSRLAGVGESPIGFLSSDCSFPGEGENEGVMPLNLQAESD